MQLADKYAPQDIEAKWYDFWIQHRFFHSEPDKRQPYTIVIPPPNVTGMLHMGHMLNNTLQDVLIRRARMTGRNACWVPGMDHASIATEAKVVAMLHEKGIEKSQLTREEFLRYAWEWKEKYGGMILRQLRKLGASCDWERTCFTMDEVRTRSVIHVFCDLYEKGKIYRGVRMVNWDPAAKTALSDEEVVFKESHGKLYYLRYKIEGTEQYIVVATTRPETILGDTALCVNPNDPRYASLPADARVIVPLVGRSIPVIRDEYVDIDFGTGALKVTPAHDVNDYMLGEKYNLETIDIFNDDGTVNDKVGMYVGQDRFDVRRQIEKDLDAAGLLEKTEDYTNNVGYSERTGVAIEPKLSMQWFLSMQELAEPATKAVMEDAIRFVPEKYKNTYRHWMENIKDWCISRQLWWGQRIPAYYLPKGGYVVAETAEEALEKARIVLWITTADEPGSNVGSNIGNKVDSNIGSNVGSNVGNQSGHNAHNAPDTEAALKAEFAATTGIELTSEQILYRIINKIDLHSDTDNSSAATADGAEDRYTIRLSAKTGEGIRTLVAALARSVDATAAYRGEAIVTNQRHYHALCEALTALDAALDGLQHGLTSELLSEDIRAAINHLGEITGEITSDDILQNIFSKFCIGK